METRKRLQALKQQAALRHSILALALAWGCSTITEAAWPGGGGMPVADAELAQHAGRVAATPDGGCYISWFDHWDAGCDVYLQRLDAYGNELWPHGGILVADREAVTYATQYGLVVDAAGNAWLTFRDDRFVANGVQLTVAKVTPAGDLVWGPDGLQLSAPDGVVDASWLVMTSDNQVAVAWDAGDNIELRRLELDGSVEWTVSLAASSGWLQCAGMIASDNGSVIIQLSQGGPMWWDPNLPLAQKVDSEGTLLWGSDHHLLCDDTLPLAWGNYNGLVSDDAGGAVFMWGSSPGGSEIQTRVQHVHADGSDVFGANGVQAEISAEGDFIFPTLHFNASNQSTFVVSEFYLLDTGLYGLAAQKLDATGTRLWGATGMELVAPVEGARFAPKAVNLDGDLLVAGAYASPQGTVISAFRLQPDGTPAWMPEQTVVCQGGIDDPSSIEIALTRYDAAIITWTSTINDGGDIHAQALNGDGTMGLPMWAWADFGGDQIIDFDDYVTFRAAFGATTGSPHYLPAADHDNDGYVSVLDYHAWLTAYRLFTGDSAAAPPLGGGSAVEPVKPRSSVHFQGPRTTPGIRP